jgi:hypothetical protein
MCVDYTGLNKACPKVPYPLPRIDQIVDSTVGCETLSFLDAYSGYHQIRMKESDQLWRKRPNYSSLSAQVAPLKAATHLNRNNSSVPRI